MRVFKTLIKLSIIIYFFSICLDLWVDNLASKEKFQILKKDNLSVKKTEKRLILYGSSDCEYGLSAELISKNFSYSVLNLCKYGIFREKFKKNLQNILLTQTRKNDIIVYVVRLNLETVSLEEDGILGFLLPQVRIATNFIFENFKNNKKYFNSFGDLIYYPRKNVDFNYLNYNIDYDIINKSLKKSVYQILNDSNLKSKVIVVTTPILIDSKSRIELNKINFECSGTYCDKFITWIPPLLIDNKEYYATIGPRHLNPEKGRIFWTKDLIQSIANLKDISSN
jgi:hypothetical protein